MSSSNPSKDGSLKKRLSNWVTGKQRGANTSAQSSYPKPQLTVHEHFLKMNKEHELIQKFYKKCDAKVLRLKKHSISTAEQEMKLGETLISFAQLMQLNPEFATASKKFGQNFQSLSKLRNQTDQVIDEYLKTTQQLRKEDTRVGKLRQKYDADKAQYMDFNLLLPPFGDTAEMASDPTPASIERLDAEPKKEYLAKVEKTQNEFFELAKNLNLSYSNLYNELDFQIRTRDVVYWEQLRALMYAYSCYFETGLMLSKQLETLCKPKQHDEHANSHAILKKIDGTAGLQEGFDNVALGTRGVDKKLSRVNARRKIVEIPLSVFPDVIGKNKLFGMKLEAIMITDPQTGRREIPPSIQQLFDLLYQYGLRIEGIFRVPGDNLYMESLKVVLEKNEVIPMMTHKAHFIHSIAGLLKLFIRDLAEPLMTYSAFDTIIPLGNPSLKKTDDEIAEEVRKFILKEVPPDNVEFLFQFCKLLATICENAEVNKMHATNLGLIMGMSFFKPKGDDPMKIATSVQNMSKVSAVIITHFKTILKHKFEEENGVTVSSDKQVVEDGVNLTKFVEIDAETELLETDTDIDLSNMELVGPKLALTVANSHQVESDDESGNEYEDDDLPMIVTERSLPFNLPKLAPLLKSFQPPSDPDSVSASNINAISALPNVPKTEDEFDMSQLNGLISSDLIQNLSNTSSRVRGSMARGSRNVQ